MYIITLTLIYVITGREFIRKEGIKVRKKRVFDQENEEQPHS
jgi:hypothetical protein